MGNRDDQDEQYRLQRQPRIYPTKVRTLDAIKNKSHLSLGSLSSATHFSHDTHWQPPPLAGYSPLQNTETTEGEAEIFLFLAHVRIQSFPLAGRAMPINFSCDSCWGRSPFSCFQVKTHCDSNYYHRVPALHYLRSDTHTAIKKRATTRTGSPASGSSLPIIISISLILAFQWGCNDSRKYTHSKI